MDNATNMVETAQMILMLIYDECRRRKMFTINDNYLKLPGSYLFSNIAKK